LCAGDSSDDAHGEHRKWGEHHPVSGTHDRGRQDQGGGGTYTFTCISTRSPPDKIPSGQNPLWTKSPTERNPFADTGRHKT